VRARPLLALLLAAGSAALVACGGDEPTPEAVIRAWSDALNASEDERAAAFFADGARVIRGVRSFSLEDTDEALRFARSLPCGGEIVSLASSGDRIEATIELTPRPGRRCAVTGTRTGLIVRVDDGRIVLWHEVPADGAGEGRAV
jgi:hypothetical protein